MRDIIIFAMGTLFGIFLLMGISVIVMQWAMRKDAVNENYSVDSQNETEEAK